MSQRDAQETIIGEWSYRIYPLPPRKSIGVLTRLLRVLAPGLSTSDAKEILDTDAGTLLERVAQHIDDDTVWWVVDTMAAVCEVRQGSGAWTNLGTMMARHFVGDDLSLLRWLVWALGVQYRPLFEGLASAGADGAGDLLSRLSAQSTSPG